MSDLVSTSLNAVSFDFFFAAYEIGRILLRNHMLPLASIAAVFKLSRPYIHTSGWVQYIIPGLFIL